MEPANAIASMISFFIPIHSYIQSRMAHSCRVAQILLAETKRPTKRPIRDSESMLYVLVRLRLCCNPAEMLPPLGEIRPTRAKDTFMRSADNCLQYDLKNFVSFTSFFQTLNYILSLLYGISFLTSISTLPVSVPRQFILLGTLWTLHTYPPLRRLCSTFKSMNTKVSPSNRFREL